MELGLHPALQRHRELVFRFGEPLLEDEKLPRGRREMMPAVLQFVRFEVADFGKARAGLEETFSVKHWGKLRAAVVRPESS